MTTDARYLLLYDGVCGLCNRSVQFILLRDRHQRFEYMPLQSQTAIDLLARHDVVADLNTFILVERPGTEQESLATKYRAALVVARGLGGWMRLAAAWAWWMPRPVGNWLYDQVAQRRYAWFGKADACLLPTPEQRERFRGLDDIQGPTQGAA